MVDAIVVKLKQASFVTPPRIEIALSNFMHLLFSEINNIFESGRQINH